MLCGLVALLCVQCSKTELMVAMTDVNVRSWSDEATIEHENKDTSNQYDLDIVLHINDRFAANEVELEITMLSPDSLRCTEQVTISVNSQRPDVPTAQAADITLPYRRDTKLSSKGNYIFRIKPLKPIVGVEAAGVHFQAQ